MVMDSAAGSRLLGEVEEKSLEIILDGLRATANGEPASKSSMKTTHMQDLDDLAAQQFRETRTPTLAISGRYEPLLYKVVSALVSPPHSYALMVIDIDGRFDATRLTCEDADTGHIYVQQPSRPSVRSNIAMDDNNDRSSPHYYRMVAEAETFMLYSDSASASASRRWWGTILVGGVGAADIVAGWKGWLRVDRENIRGFPLGSSVEEALEKRFARQEAVEAASWEASSQWGGFPFREQE